MSVLEKIFAAGKAIQAGESLKDPAAWKNKQQLMNALTIILGVVPTFIDIDLAEADINAISYGVATGVAVVNLYLTAATSTKVGLPGKRNGG